MMFLNAYSWFFNPILLRNKSLLTVQAKLLIAYTSFCLHFDHLRGWYTFRPKVLSETYIFFYTFRPLAETYLYVITLYDQANQNFYFWFRPKVAISAKNYKIYVSAKIRFSTYFFFYKGKGKGGSLNTVRFGQKKIGRMQ